MIINVDPGGFTGNYAVSGVDDRPMSGQRSLVIVPGVIANGAYKDAGYILRKDTRPVEHIRFNVDAIGNVGVNEHHRVRAFGRGNTLVLAP